MKSTRNFCSIGKSCLLITLVMAICVPLGTVALGADDVVENYKMLSTLEYSGKGQFRNQVETLLTVKKHFLSDDQVRYFISSKEFGLGGTSTSPDQEPSANGLSFIISRKSGHISEAGQEMGLLEKIHNSCAASLKHTTKENIGKTWKESFKLSSLNYSLPEELNLTLTAIQVNTGRFGPMIAVRALSEPFTVKVLRVSEKMQNVTSRVAAVYLFDPAVENIYLSITVFEGTTNITGVKETFRHELAAYRTTADGTSVNLEGLGKDFERFASKVGLSNQALKVEKQAPLPQWAQSEGLHAAQAGGICAAMACEGAMNPVATITMPASQMMALQSAGKLAPAASGQTISSVLVKSIPGMGGMKIAVAPVAFLGIGATPAAAIAGGTVGTVAVAGGFDSGGSDSRSPTTP
jgi:hypothetical protein